ncbi:MAG: hypothetical protein VKK80_14975 [Prochlorothrix sp.]|nr:hypothetical protein [Prochlorothrix sp.]
MTDSPLNWKFWLPVELGTLAVGIAIGTFVGSIYITSGIVPTVATGMMISFTVGGFAGWLDTQRQVIKAAWFAGVILAVAVWAGALNLGIAASLAPIALWQAFLPEQSPPWQQICQVLGAIGGVAGGTITGMVLIRQQAAMAHATLAHATGDSPAAPDPDPTLMSSTNQTEAQTFDSCRSEPTPLAASVPVNPPQDP